MMNKAEIESFAKTAMSMQPSLKDWTFRFIKTRRVMGQCDYQLKRIEVSERFIGVVSDLDMKDTVLHEIAHAITDPGAGHDWKWKKAAKMLGANPSPISVLNDSQANRLATWAMFYQGKIVHRYYRKPNQSVFAQMNEAFIPGIPESLGNLILRQL